MKELEQQRERRTKQAGTEQAEIEEEDKNGQEEEKATRTMWETRQACKHKCREENTGGDGL